MTEVKLHIHVNMDNRPFITPERIDLLKKIQQTGSLNAAAKALSISYQHAWNIIDGINKQSAQPIVVKLRGGNGGGGASISEYGQLILREYSFIEQQVTEYATRLNNEINF